MALDNPAIHELFEVEYNIVFKDDLQDRQTGRFRFEGRLPLPSDILFILTQQQADRSWWNNVQKVEYSVARLMNNDSHVNAERGEINSQQLIEFFERAAK